MIRSRLMLNRNWTTLILLSSLIWLTTSKRLCAEGLHPYKPASFSGGKLFYEKNVPILVLSGASEEIGTQVGTLTSTALKQLVSYPEKFAKAHGSKLPFNFFVGFAQNFLSQCPKHHYQELRAAAKASAISEKELLAANVLPDMYRAFGCSSLMIPAEQSATGSPLMGRNLDFYALGMLHRFTVVSVIHQQGGNTRLLRLVFQG